MKAKYNKIAMGAAVLALSLAAVSCNGELDLAPKGEITKEQINDNSIESLMSAAYAGLECHFFGNNESFAGPIANWVFDVPTMPTKAEEASPWKVTSTSWR